MYGRHTILLVSCLVLIDTNSRRILLAIPVMIFPSTFDLNVLLYSSPPDALAPRARTAVIRRTAFDVVSPLRRNSPRKIGSLAQMRQCGLH
jgi:hypothetical protein